MRIDPNINTRIEPLKKEMLAGQPKENFAEMVTKSGLEQNHLEILSLVGDIKGLLINIYS